MRICRSPHSVMGIIWALGPLLILAPLAGYSHVRLIDSEPAADSRLTASPDQILLQFSEPVQPVSLRLIDSDGLERASGQVPQVIDSSIVLSLDKALDPGRYLVSYRVLSGDAHPIAASFEFSVRPNAEVSTAAQVTVPASQSDIERVALDEASWDVAVIAARIAFMLSLLLTAGGALFLQLVSSPESLQQTRRLVVGFGLIGLLTALSYLQLSGAGMLGSAGLPDAAALAMAARTSLGLSLALTVTGLVVLVGSGARPGGWLVVSIVLMIAGRVVTGHPVSREPGWLLMPAMGLHVTAAAFWYGSLPPLLFALARLPVADAAAVVRRFSRVAIFLVGCLALAGVMMAFIHLATPAALLDTWYGQLLIMKATWFSVLLGFGAWHKLRLSPRLEAGDRSAARHLRLSIIAEMVVMTLVVFISANLASTSPEAPTRAAQAAAATDQPLNVGSLQGNDSIQLDPTSLGGKLR